MPSFLKFGLRKQLFNAIEDLGFVTPTPIQDQAFSVILSGKDILGIAQTGTGKTLGYMMPLLDELKFSKQLNPRILILIHRNH
jgi:ATP-dependent RNA helicase RhlE